MISVNDITFAYKRGNNVLQDFSLELNEGGIYGLLGKNGTGKSTLLYLITGLLRPQRGSITYNGVVTSLRRPDVLQQMFIVPEEYNLPSVMLSQYVASLKPFYPNFDETQMQQYLQGFDLPGDLDMGALSMGQKKKVYMCIALAANTPVLVMDEPTNGLDIPSKAQFRRVVGRCMKQDRIIIISTHQVRDVEQVLDRLLVVERNRVLLNATMAQVQQRLAFSYVPFSQVPEDAVYTEDGPQGGVNVITPKTSPDDAPVNLELLFDALLADARKINNLVKA